MTDATTYASKLAGARILVVGGSSGIGFAVANAVLEQGAAAVIIASSSADRIKAAIGRIREAYPNKSKNAELLGVPVDLKDQSNLEKNVEKLLGAATADKTKKLDHIVFTAGDSLATNSEIEKVTLQQIQEAGMVRFFAPLVLCSRAPAFMNAGPKASITLTTGSVSQRPLPGWAAIAPYATGIHGMARSMAVELKPIRVNAISPGAVLTELWDSFEPAQREAVVKHVSGSLLTGQIGKVEDVAETYLMCMKDQNCTASVIDSNGGGLIA